MKQSARTGLLLTNTGTPDAPTLPAVRRYLREFLSDKRVVNLPRFIWLPILYGLILTLRPKKSARLYQQIWTPLGSPMRTFMQSLTNHLREKIQPQSGSAIEIEYGMNYGHPSIPSALEKLRKKNIEQLIVLPLFPQYSNTTTASTFDKVASELQKWPALPAFKLIRDYATQQEYLDALAESVRSHWNPSGKADHLLISFHGIPERFANAGDPYPQQCQQTAERLAQALNLRKEEWSLCYQSRFGYDKWLKPYTQELLQTLPRQGVRRLDVICPGFSVDCLETLEEIVIRGTQFFRQAGGETLRYIPAQNDSHAHVKTLAALFMHQG